MTFPPVSPLHQLIFHIVLEEINVGIPVSEGWSSISLPVSFLRSLRMVTRAYSSFCAQGSVLTVLGAPYKGARD